MDLRTQLIAEEGRRHAAYQDTLGIWTIGVGHVDPSIKAGVIWNDAMIDATLDRDIAQKTAEVEGRLPWFSQLDEPRQAVLLQMAFQMGTKGLLGFPSTLAAVRDGRWADAQSGMLNSLWAKQTPARVSRLSEQMLTGEWVT